MIPSIQTALTMTSREIAELTGKNHFDVTRDIINIFSQAEIDASKFAVTYKDAQNRNQTEYLLPKRECDLVVSGYSVKYRLAMRKRLKAPVSQTVINRFAIELKKAKAYGYTVDQCLAECVTRGWRGFETQWLVNSSQNGQYKTAAEKAACNN